MNVSIKVVREWAVSPKQEGGQHGDRLFRPEILIFLALKKDDLGALEQLIVSVPLFRTLHTSATMAPIKRKGNAAEEASARQPQKRVRVGAEDRKKDQKKQKTASNDSNSKPDANSAPKASELSVLRDDEPSFPRGGGSVLTPLERKQIQIQATKDVLFEQKGSKPSAGDFGDDGMEDTDMEDAGDDTKSAAAKKSRKKKTKGKKDAEKDATEKKDVRIEGLNFKVCFWKGK